MAVRFGPIRPHLTAGASTPDTTINEFAEKLATRAPPA